MSVVAFRRRTSPPFPWRTAAVLIALFALLVAGLVYVGAQPRLPPPFGLAGNGLVAYSKDGDILTVDPATGTRRWVTSGTDIDEQPRWSLDGTRLAFFRLNGLVRPDVFDYAEWRVVIVDRDRNVVATSVPIRNVDPDAFAWSPDGRSLAVGASGTLALVDAADGAYRALDVTYEGLDIHWRPGQPHEILFRGRTADGIGLVVADVEDPGSARLVVKDRDHEVVRPNGWTSDGRRVVYTRLDDRVDQPPGSERLHVLDLTTLSDVEIQAAYGHVSNDGTRLLAVDLAGQPCVAPIDGGPCVVIGDAADAYSGFHAEAVHWAPDDTSIMVLRGSGRTVLLDPAGDPGAQPEWLADGGQSWQRVVP
ncbi:MAG TPA: hypothetical protein VFM38_05725 [Candidatus Limnocylindrales bacterium]|nr:hypothetical protein [Candidatus Limnocylindrales bacterium]